MPTSIVIVIKQLSVISFRERYRAPTKALMVTTAVRY